MRPTPRKTHRCATDRRLWHACARRHLDYSRLSDVYDTVGFWHVEPLDQKRCIVYYTQDSLLPAWIPTPLKKTFTNAAMKACTAKLEPACISTMRRNEQGGLFGGLGKRFGLQR